MDYDNSKGKPAQPISTFLENILAQAAQIKEAQQTQNKPTVIPEIFLRDAENEYGYSPQDEARNHQWEDAQDHAAEENYDTYERELRRPKKQIAEEASPGPLLSPASMDAVGTTIGALNIITLDELLSLSVPPREMILSPFLPSQGLVMIAAARGVGKTLVAVGIAYAVATGKTFLKWSAPQPKRVLYIDGEMPLSLLQERLQMAVDMNGQKPEPDFLQILTPDRQDTVMPDLSTPQGCNAVEPLIADVDLVVVDNISCLFRKGSENEAETWQSAQDWALDWRRRGKSILFVHHTGKNGWTPRGNSKREDILDTVIILKHPESYDASEGAHFEIHFTKARHFRGEDATPFETHLTEHEDKPSWKMSSIAPEALTEEVADLSNAGNTIEQIRKALGLTKSQVETQLKKGRQQGLIEAK